MALPVMPEGIQVEKSLVAGRTCQPHPKWSPCTCAQIVAHEVVGPSLQPSTQHL